MKTPFEKELDKLDRRREIKYMLIDFLLAVLFFVIAVFVVSAIIPGV